MCSALARRRRPDYTVKASGELEEYKRNTSGIQAEHERNTSEHLAGNRLAGGLHHACRTTPGGVPWFQACRVADFPVGKAHRFRRLSSPPHFGRFGNPRYDCGSTVPPWITSRSLGLVQVGERQHKAADYFIAHTEETDRSRRNTLSRRVGLHSPLTAGILPRPPPASAPAAFHKCGAGRFEWS